MNVKKGLLDGVIKRSSEYFIKILRSSRQPSSQRVPKKMKVEISVEQCAPYHRENLLKSETVYLYLLFDGLRIQYVFLNFESSLVKTDADLSNYHKELLDRLSVK